MSEQEKPMSFMQELDEWTGTNIIAPIQNAYTAPSGDCDTWIQTVEAVQKAIRTKVLESYRNGLKAGARPVKKEPR